MSDRKVLIVTKDRAEFHVYHPVALALEKAGCEVIVVAEGLSMEMWVKSGRQIYQGLPKEGTYDPNTKMRLDIDPLETLTQISPDVVLTGLANPINLGEQFGLAANGLGFKVGLVEDLWGVHRRSKATPNFICTPDDYGSKVINQSWMGGHYKTPVYTFVTGSPSMDALQSVVPDPGTSAIINGNNADIKRVILIGGQDESTTPLVRGLLEASNQDEGWLIIPRFHPKWMSDPTKSTYRDEWVKLLYQMELRHRVLWTPPSIDMWTLIPLATEVVSIYSTCLIEAVGLGAIPVSWTSDIGRQKMAGSLGGATRFPAVKLGACLEVSTPQEFLHNGLGPEDLSGSFQTTASFKKGARETLGLDGRATERVVQAILEYLQ